jgi:hypothetical protein
LIDFRLMRKSTIIMATALAVLVAGSLHAKS